ncbi:MAG: hypothetical protein HC836_22715 [Richelia sp. RM2_1_2]|nr:hypothetical protein [Richelia sp. RM2_1_2]
MNIDLTDNISKLPIVISPEDQNYLLELFLHEIQNNHPLVEHTRINATRMTLRDHSERSTFPYTDRTNINLDWRWIDHPIAEKIQEILAPLSKFVSDITRVSIQIQPQDKAAAPHWDDGGFRREKWPNNAYHGYVIRAPLTTTKNNVYIHDLINAPFFAVVDGKKINVSSDNHLFMYDARKTFHGGDYRPWVRGILGIFGASINEKPNIPLRITSTNSIKNFDEWSTNEKIYKYFYNKSPELFTIYSNYLEYTVGAEIYNSIMEMHYDMLPAN